MAGGEQVRGIGLVEAVRGRRAGAAAGSQHDREYSDAGCLPLLAWLERPADTSQVDESAKHSKNATRAVQLADRPRGLVESRVISATDGAW
jgi:hypothetical protein